jgi:hypothetical protein
VIIQVRADIRFPKKVFASCLVEMPFPSTASGAIIRRTLAAGAAAWLASRTSRPRCLPEIYRRAPTTSGPWDVEADFMKREIRVAVAVASIAGASLTLASCGRPDNHVAVSRPVPHQAPSARPMAEEPPAGGSEAVWSVRAGLNVAALSCRGRGRQPVAGEYARMLTHHRELLATAYRREQERQGARAFDRQQTRIYNTFANQTSPVRFCGTASSVAHRVNGLDSAGFTLAAPHMLGELRASLR